MPPPGHQQAEVNRQAGHALVRRGRTELLQRSGGSGELEPERLGRFACAFCGNSETRVTPHRHSSVVMHASHRRPWRAKPETRWPQDCPIGAAVAAKCAVLQGGI